jgi:copper chaperone
MDANTKTRPLLEGSTGGCSCCAPAATPTDTQTAPSTATASTEENDVSTQTYSVTGMTCGHCVQAVISELKELDGVSDVDVDLVAGGTSTVTVTGTGRLEETRVAAALDEAGDYQLA